MSRAAEYWRSPLTGEPCALLLHSSDRAEARPFWRPVLRLVARHFPPRLCDLYFTYDAADAEARSAIDGLSQPFMLIRRGEAGRSAPGWSGSLRSDLSLLREVHRYAWVFHLMDDAVIPDPIERSTLLSVLDVAERHNASSITLYPRALHFWSVSGCTPAYTVNVSSSHGTSATLDFHRPAAHSRIVFSQNFALWRPEVLEWTLASVGNGTSPTGWEGVFSAKAPTPYVSQALGVSYRGADAVMGVEDIGHHGLVKAGWSTCTWIRAAERLGVSVNELPIDPSVHLQHSGYSFCGLADAIEDGAYFLRGTPDRCGCPMNKTKVDRTWKIEISCLCQEPTSAPPKTAMRTRSARECQPVPFAYR